MFLFIKYYIFIQEAYCVNFKDISLEPIYLQTDRLLNRLGSSIAKGENNKNVHKSDDNNYNHDENIISSFLQNIAGDDTVDKKNVNKNDMTDNHILDFIRTEPYQRPDMSLLPRQCFRRCDHYGYVGHYDYKNECIPDTNIKEIYNNCSCSDFTEECQIDGANGVTDLCFWNLETHKCDEKKETGTDCKNDNECIFNICLDDACSNPKVLIAGFGSREITIITGRNKDDKIHNLPWVIECPNLIKSDIIEEVEYIGHNPAYQINLDSRVWYTDPKNHNRISRCTAKSDAGTYTPSKKVTMNIWSLENLQSYHITVDITDTQRIFESGYDYSDPEAHNSHKNSDESYKDAKKIIEAAEKKKKPNINDESSNIDENPFLPRLCTGDIFTQKENVFITLKVGVFVHQSIILKLKEFSPKPYEKCLMAVEELFAAVNIVYGMQLNVLFKVQKLIFVDKKDSFDTELEYWMYSDKSLISYMPHIISWINRRERKTAGGWIMLHDSGVEDDRLAFSSSTFGTKHAVMVMTTGHFAHYGWNLYTPPVNILLHQIGHWLGAKHPYFGPYYLHDKKTVKDVTGFTTLHNDQAREAAGIMNINDMRYNGIIQMPPQHASRMCRHMQNLVQYKMIDQLPFEQIFYRPINCQDGRLYENSMWEPVIGGFNQTYFCTDQKHKNPGGNVATRYCNNEGHWDKWDYSQCQEKRTLFCEKSWIGDGYCDPECFNAENVFDRKDCECIKGQEICDGVCLDKGICKLREGCDSHFYKKCNGACKKPEECEDFGSTPTVLCKTKCEKGENSFNWCFIGKDKWDYCTPAVCRELLPEHCGGPKTNWMISMFVKSKFTKFKSTNCAWSPIQERCTDMFAPAGHGLIKFVETVLYPHQHSVFASNQEYIYTGQCTLLHRIGLPYVPGTQRKHKFVKVLCDQHADYIAFIYFEDAECINMDKNYDMDRFHNGHDHQRKIEQHEYDLFGQYHVNEHTPNKITVHTVWEGECMYDPKYSYLFPQHIITKIFEKFSFSFTFHPSDSQSRSPVITFNQPFLLFIPLILCSLCIVAMIIVKLKEKTDKKLFKSKKSINSKESQQRNPNKKISKNINDKQENEADQDLENKDYDDSYDDWWDDDYDKSTLGTMGTLQKPKNNTTKPYFRPPGSFATWEEESITSYDLSVPFDNKSQPSTKVPAVPLFQKGKDFMKTNSIPTHSKLASFGKNAYQAGKDSKVIATDESTVNEKKIINESMITHVHQKNKNQDDNIDLKMIIHNDEKNENEKKIINQSMTAPENDKIDLKMIIHNDEKNESEKKITNQSMTAPIFGIPSQPVDVHSTKHENETDC